MAKPKSKSLPATTTKQEDVVTSGQQVVNLMWETTQARIAVYVVVCNLTLNSLVCLAVLTFNIDLSVNQLALISLCIQPISLTTGIVIGFYFGRSNHTKIGGIGPKEGER